MNLGEVGCQDVDWLHLAVDKDQCRALVNTVMNFRYQNYFVYFTALPVPQTI
jgi:hypothetical protein